MLTLWKAQKPTTFEKVFDEFFGDGGLESFYERNFSPNIDIRESKDKVIVEAELAGLEKKDVKVTYDKGMLKITGEKKYDKETDDEYAHRVERRYGSFQRVVPLNEDVIKADDINAQFKNGVLRIEIGKVEEKKTKEIEVKVS